jgi:hypothetical protein
MSGEVRRIAEALVSSGRCSLRHGKQVCLHWLSARLNWNNFFNYAWDVLWAATCTNYQNFKSTKVRQASGHRPLDCAGSLVAAVIQCLTKQEMVFTCMLTLSTPAVTRSEAENAIKWRKNNQRDQRMWFRVYCVKRLNVSGVARVLCSLKHYRVIWVRRWPET